MSILIKGMQMPESCYYCPFADGSWGYSPPNKKRCLISGKDMPVDERSAQQNQVKCPLIELPPHGDLIDRDALMKDGWLSLHKEVMRMGGYAIHELPLKNPSIPVIIEKENY